MENRQTRRRNAIGIIRVRLLSVWVGLRMFYSGFTKSIGSTRSRIWQPYWWHSLKLNKFPRRIGDIPWSRP